MKKPDEFDERLKEAERQYQAARTDLRELYVFLFNGREREFDTRKTKWEDPEEIFDSTAAEANMEFTGDLFSYATPDVTPWVEFEVGSAVDEEQVQQVTEVVEAREVGAVDDGDHPVDAHDLRHLCDLPHQRPRQRRAARLHKDPMRRELVQRAQGVGERRRLLQNVLDNRRVFAALQALGGGLVAATCVALPRADGGYHGDVMGVWSNDAFTSFVLIGGW